MKVGVTCHVLLYFIKWRWYRHKDLFISWCPQGLSEESQSVACIISLCSCSFASSECAPAAEVLYLPECYSAASDGVAWQGYTFSCLYGTGGVRRNGFGCCRNNLLSFGKRQDTPECWTDFALANMKSLKLFLVEKDFWNNGFLFALPRSEQRLQFCFITAAACCFWAWLVSKWERLAQN